MQIGLAREVEEYGSIEDFLTGEVAGRSEEFYAMHLDSTHNKVDQDDERVLYLQRHPSRATSALTWSMASTTTPVRPLAAGDDTAGHRGGGRNRSGGLAAPQIGNATPAATPTLASHGDEWHVMRFESDALDARQIGEPGSPGYREISVDALKSDRGRTVGYNSISSRLDPDTGLFTSRLGIALRNGALVAKIKQDRGVSENRYITIRGPIKGGVGRFAGTHGRVLVKIDTEDPQGGQHADVRIRWRRA